MLAPFERPEALRNGVEYVYAQTGKPILVSENGINTVYVVPAAMETSCKGSQIPLRSEFENRPLASTN